MVTGYIPQNGSRVGWKIFYADTNNIYLIADNYVKTDKLPSGINANGEITNNKPTVGDKERTAYFGEALREDYATGTDRIVDLVKNLNKSYFIDKSFTNQYGNIKAVAYMLDIKAWSNFKDAEGKALYAIGGPTIEMLFKSYNQKHLEKSYEAKATSSTGYQIRINDGEWKNCTEESLEYLDMNDEMYVINDTTIMWVASPANGSGHATMGCNGSGRIDFYNIERTDMGFRPVVCLNSNVQLHEAENGFIIK